MELGQTIVAFRRKQIGSPVFLAIIGLLALGTLVVAPWAFLIVLVGAGAWVGMFLALNTAATKKRGRVLEVCDRGLVLMPPGGGRLFVNYNEVASLSKRRVGVRVEGVPVTQVVYDVAINDPTDGVISIPMFSWSEGSTRTRQAVQVITARAALTWHGDHARRAGGS